MSSLARLAPLLLVVPLAAPARAAPVDDEVWAAFGERAEQRVLVSLVDERPARVPSRIFDPEAAAARLARRTAELERRKTGLLERLAAAGRRARVAKRYPPFATIALDVDREAVEALAADPEVRALSYDFEERPQLATTLEHVSHAAAPGRAPLGQGVSVAVLDTPIRHDGGFFGTCPQPGAPGCRVRVSLSFSDQTVEEVRAAEDRYGRTSHGTNVAGIAGGVAPGADLLSLNVFYGNEERRSTRSRVSDQLDALSWVAENALAYDIVAVNMSLGGDRFRPDPCNGGSRFDAFRTLTEDLGVSVVVSSGNDATQNAVSRPACISSAITVAAQFDDPVRPYSSGTCEDPSPYPGKIVCFSNLNGQVDMVAPGVRVDAAGITKSGTSMAAPHVAGAIAVAQAHFQQSTGARRDARWVEQWLWTRASRPLLHTDGRRFAQLDFGSGVGVDASAAFPAFAGEFSGGRLDPSRGFTATVSGAGTATVAGVYLGLHLAHDHPERVELVLEAPGGAQASLRMPAGQANFSGLVGATIAPGAFAALAGAPAEGRWRLRLTDTSTAPSGHYMAATLHLVLSDCAPSCAGRCGDDGCGGSCGGLCVIEGACVTERDRPAADPCLVCDPATSTSAWSEDRRRCRTPLGCFAAGEADQTAPCRVCDPSRDRTELSLAPDTCEAGGRCYAAGERAVGGGCSACDPSEATRFLSPLDGASCDDSNPCTTDDSCAAGICTGTAVVCAAEGPCRATGVCDRRTGTCTDPPAPDGTACDDDRACTRNDACAGGACGGELACAPGPCEVGGACGPGGGCVFDLAPDGTTCPGGQCQRGACAAIEPPPPEPSEGCRCLAPRGEDAGPGLVIFGGWLGVLLVRRGRRARHRLRAR